MNKKKSFVLSWDTSCLTTAKGQLKNQHPSIRNANRFKLSLSGGTIQTESPRFGLCLEL